MPDDVPTRHERYVEELRADVRAGLTATPKTLPPKYFYDARGSELFDEITRLPEYYPTRAETAILEQNATEIAELSRCESLVELGSGTSSKTRLLLQALLAGGTLQEFVPFDVDPVVLAEASAALTEEYAGCASRRSSATSSMTWPRSPATAAAPSRSWARRAATSNRAPGPTSWPASAQRCSPVTRSCSGPTW